MNHSASYILPKGWEMTLSSDYCESIADGTHDTPSPVAHNGVPLYTSKNLTDRNELLIDDAYLISLEDSIEINKRSYVNRHDILFGMIGTVGNPVIIQIEENDFSVKNVCIFRFGGDVTKSKWLYYFLKSDYFDFQINRLLDGSTQKFVPLSTLRNLKVPVPINIRQQQKIAKILTTVDNLIEKTQALIEKYTAIKQGMMADLFTRGIDLSGTPDTNPNHGQPRPPYEQAPELYKQTELGWVPKEWELTNLGDCCEVSNNLRKPISAEEREKIKGDYSYYGCTGILDFIDEYRVDGEYVIIGEDGDHFLKFSRQEMTILIDGKFNVNNHAHIVSGTEKCRTEWFHFYFVHRDITYFLTRQGAGRFKLKKETLLELPMLLPSITEQKAIYSRYQSINGKQNIERKYLAKLSKTKKGLMQDLLTGKVKVA
jgi:type I restriction enzyme S subunit